MTSRAFILVAGRSGRLAQALMSAGARAGFPIRAIGRPRLDIEDYASIERIIAADPPGVIINAAGMVNVDGAEQSPDLTFAVNRDGAALLAAAAARAAIPLVHVSTDYVFDGRKAAPYIESDQPAPLSVYGKSKLAGEEAVLAAHSSAVIVRTSWVFGPDGKSFLTTMLNLAKAKDVIPVVADQRGSPTAVTDFAQALIAISRQALDGGTGSRSGIYHVSGGGEATWFTFAHAIFSGWARRGFRVPRIEPILLADWSSLARRPLDSRLDCSKARHVFGVALPDWRGAVEDTLDELANRVAAPP